MTDTPENKTPSEEIPAENTVSENVQVLPEIAEGTQEEAVESNEPPPPDISLDAALAADMAKQKKKGKGKRSLPSVKLEKKHKIILGAGIGLLLVVLAIYSERPKQGSMAYGICSTFLELNTPYPHTIRHIALEGSRTAVRIYYTNVDPFGEFKQEMIECTYGADSNGSMRVTQITRNRKPVDAAQVTDFNKILGTVVSSDPYRVPPPNWKNPLVPE